MCQIELAEEASRDGMPKAGVGQPERAIWKMMIQSCVNPRNRDFKRCGELGIRVCDRWLGSEGFANFVADVGPQPAPGAGLQRRNADQHFEPGNVAWADTRSKRTLTYDGRSMSIAAWAREFGINERTLRARLRQHWPIAQALSQRLAVRDHLAYFGPRKKGRQRRSSDSAVTM